MEVTENYSGVVLCHDFRPLAEQGYQRFLILYNI
jgi:hypothetical protein